MLPDPIWYETLNILYQLSIFQGKTPIICGGYKSEKSIDSCDCYALENGAWNSMAGLTECRRYAASTLVTNQLEEQVKFSFSITIK